MQNRYNILQSGFLSLENKQLLTPQAVNQDLEFDAYILNKPYKDTENLFFYHKAISDLFDEYNADYRNSANFAFQEKFLIAFIDALSTQTFAQWIDLQFNNARLSEIHVKFLIDTLNFIRGMGRCISVDSWQLLIDKDNPYNKAAASKIELSDYFDSKDFIYENSLKLDKIPYNLPLTLQCWITQPMGFSDLVVTADIIFGKKEKSKTL
jgi:hypothetical protein